MSKKRVLTLCGLIIAVLLATGTGDSDRTGGSSRGTAPSTVDLNATVRFTGTQFVIKNDDSFDWTNVKLEINSGLISGGYVLNAERMRPGETYTVGAMQFAKSDGERFNPLTHKPQKLSVWCDTPRGKGFYLGGWK